MHVCMLSILHPADDARIVEKEARSLVAAGHRVTVIARPPAPADRGGIEFKLLERPAVPRWKRPWVAGRQALALARSLRPDVVQFHDPELMFVALALLRSGCKVVYDVHEDVPADIHSKRWIPRTVRPLVALAAGAAERMTARRFDAVVPVTPEIADRFRRYGANVTVVRNSVKLSEFPEAFLNDPRKRQAVYVGRISFDRGLVEMAEACRMAELPLVIAGDIGPAERAWLESHPAGVEWRGKLDRVGIATLMCESAVGICLLHPEPNYLHALPTKLFEYMAAGLPVITSDVPASREIVEGAACGFAIAHGNADELKERLVALTTDGAVAREMGLRGRAAVSRWYNWEDDVVRLLELYDRLASSIPPR